MCGFIFVAIKNLINHENNENRDPRKISVLQYMNHAKKVGSNRAP